MGEAEVARLLSNNLAQEKKALDALKGIAKRLAEQGAKSGAVA